MPPGEAAFFVLVEAFVLRSRDSRFRGNDAVGVAGRREVKAPEALLLEGEGADHLFGLHFGVEFFAGEEA